MKKIIASAAICMALFSCVKEIDKTQTCAWVFDKFFQSPAGDSTANNRTYWLWLANDTLSNAPGNRYTIQVSKPTFDTMLAGQFYPQQYCY